jgi:CHAT domain-containing protein
MRVVFFVLLLSCCFASVATAQLPDVDTSQKVNAVRAEAVAALTAGEHAKAAKLFEKAAKLSEGFENKATRTTYLLLNLQQLTTVYALERSYVDVEATFRRMIAVAEEGHGKESPETANVYGQAADFFSAAGEHRRAEQLFEKGLAILDKHGEPAAISGAKMRMGMSTLYLAMRRYDDARKLLDSALATLEPKLGKDHLEVAQVLNNQAIVEHHRGDHQKAKTIYQRACAIYDKSPFPLLRAQCHLNLSGPLRVLGDHAGAEREATTARGILAKELGPRHPKTAFTLNALAQNEVARNQPDKALALLREAADIHDNDLGLLLQVGSEGQKRDFLERLKNATDGTVSLQAGVLQNDAGAIELAFRTVLRRKGLVLDALTSGMAALRTRIADNDMPTFEKLRQARTRLSATLLGTGAPAPTQNRDELIASLEREVGELEAKLSATSAAFRAHHQAPSIESVRKALPAGAALIEIVAHRPYDFRWKTEAQAFGAPRYLAYLLPKEGPVAYVDLGDGATIDRQVASLRAALADPGKDAASAAQALDDVLLDPILAKLPKGTTRLFVSPDGALNLLPFGALKSAADRYRVQDFTFVYLASGRDLLRLEGEAAPPRGGPFVLANPAFGDKRASTPGRPRTLFSRVRFTPLPGTADEAGALGGLLADSEVVVAGAAQERALKRVQAASVLHIATHGFFLGEQFVNVAGSRGLALEIEAPKPAPSGGAPAPEAALSMGHNPMVRSGLALAGANSGGGEGEDGVLTALEAAGLDLWGTQMVVLSACETGLGEVRNGDGIYGLRRALVAAGSRSQVMSLWKVDDEATRDLMVDFYGKLVGGAERATALREAQLAMISSKRAHPFFWAAFIHSGDWRGVALERGDGKNPIAGGKERGKGAPGSAARMKASPSARGCACRMPGSDAQLPAGAPLWLATVALAAMLVRRRTRRSDD